ncbi:MAG: NUDIX hydrolase [Candidatus Woesearchaeota archaeon]
MDNIIDAKSSRKRFRGVGVIITDYERDIFYLQKKCEHYPIEKYRGAHAFWGGNIEDGEDSYQALERELYEEFSDGWSGRVFEGSSLVADFDVKNGDDEYSFSLYECMLPKDDVYEILEQKVEEGEGVMATKKDLETMPFIFNLEYVVRNYLRRM